RSHLLFLPRLSFISGDLLRFLANIENRKDAKKIKFIDFKLIEDINRGSIKGGAYERLGKFLVSKESVKSFCCDSDMDFELLKEDVELKVKISGEKDLYNLSYIQFGDLKDSSAKYGFYFLFDDSGIENKDFLSAVNLIKDQGLGGEISSGKGLFNDIKIEKISLPEFSGSEFYTNLGLLKPKSNVNTDDFLYFSLTEKRGFVYNTSKVRPRYYCLSEGSLFKYDSSHFDWVVNYPVDDEEYYRLYKSIILPINWNCLSSLSQRGDNCDSN
ncbi:MAG: type III-A CRISPR-associated RAMP protein Csm4, partial [Candidatus Heimdallarchaeaceae archaeon]